MDSVAKALFALVAEVCGRWEGRATHRSWMQVIRMDKGISFPRVPRIDTFPITADLQGNRQHYVTLPAARAAPPHMSCGHH